MLRFSPRARGCSAKDTLSNCCFKVFPACAGMFRRHYQVRYSKRRFPRVRGDVPFSLVTAFGRPKFSPRARGCSPVSSAATKASIVFPACAGMFLPFEDQAMFPLSFPRVRGDVPPHLRHGTLRRPFSPRARGCSLSSCGYAWSTVVFPACAGMFRVNM